VKGGHVAAATVMWERVSNYVARASSACNNNKKFSLTPSCTHYQETTPCKDCISTDRCME